MNNFFNWIINRFKQLTNINIFTIVLGKVIIGFGLGVLLAPFIVGWGWWIVLLGLILVIPAGYQFWFGKRFK